MFGNWFPMLDNYDDAVAAAEKLCLRGGRLKPNRATAYRKLISVLTMANRWKAMIQKGKYSDSRKPKRPVASLRITGL